MNRQAATLLGILAVPLRRRSLIRRSAPVWIGLVLTVSSFIPPAQPGATISLPQIAKIPVTFAGYPCSSHAGEWPTFTGWLSNSSGTMLSESTSGDVYGRIDNADRTWEPTPGCGYYRYDAVVWATTDDTSHLRVDWGAMSGDGQACLFILNTSDYLRSGSGACGTSGKLVSTLTPEGVYHADSALDDSGAFGFAHSDCITWYGAEVIKTGATTSATSGEPGANCGNKATESTGTSQTLVVDGTAPSISFSYPAAGGPVAVPSASAAVTFSATDAVAGFSGTDDWTLTREVATWSGTACGTFGADSGTESTVNGTTNATNQVSSQGLQLNKCYRWKLTATDKNGNTASTITSGSIRTDTSGVLGDQPQYRIEGWDLGTGDRLAVSAGSGNVRVSHPIVSLPIVGGTFDLGLSYNSHDAANVGMGPGWRLNVQRRLSVNGDGSVTFTDADGSRHTFTSPTGSPTVTYTRPATLYATLTRDTAATPDRFTLTYRDQSVDIFDEDIAGTGLLKQVKDRHGNTTSVAYSAGTAKISTITDPSSRVINFTWTGSNLTSIVDWANVSAGIVQTSGAGNRTHRFFYDGSNNLIGWADPLNTAGSCPTGGSHLTCLTNTGGLLTTIAKTQTYETFSAGTLGSATRTITTGIGYEFADAISVTDAEAAAATFSHPAAGETKVTRPGTPASETTYALVSPSDAYGRIDSVKRKFGAAQIETETTYNGTYPIEPATVKENKGGGVLERVTNYTYQASSLALLTRLDEPLDGTYRRYTDFTYNANNDVTQKNVYSTDAATDHTETRYCYTSSGCSTSATDLVLRSMIENYIDGTAGGANGHVEDVTTAYTYDSAGQRTRQTRSNYSGSTLLDQAATGSTYDAYGNVTSEIRNYSNGTVDCGTDDETPNSTTNARTDLTTTYAYDTAGNRVSTADPRRAIALDADVDCGAGTPGADDYVTRTVFDALNQPVKNRLPTTTGVSDCGSPPSCRESTTTYDELGQVREAADINDLVTATQYDKGSRALVTYEDTSSDPAIVTGTNTYDAQGRLITAKDAEQAQSGATLGCTLNTYDELGRLIDVVEGSGTSPCSNTTGVSTRTHAFVDALNRVTCVEQSWTGTGTCIPTDSGNWTKTTYDIGGRVIAVDDEFRCTTTTYDYRNAALQTVQGLATGTCAGGTPVTTTITTDGLGRVTLRSVDASNVPESRTYDSAGNTLVLGGTQGGVSTTSTFTVNPLDQVTKEVRSDGSTGKSNFDPVGNTTDRCFWKPSIAVGLCLPADTASWTNPPTQAGTTRFDARNQRLDLKTRLGSSSSVATTTYDADHNYQIKAFYLPTASGKEYQTSYSYDARHRLGADAPSNPAITHVLCATNERPCSAGNVLANLGSSAYAYDDNGNRVTVTESSAGGAATTKNYCYDLLNRLRAARISTSCTTTSGDETYTYDTAGNRTSATISGSTRTFTYNSADGQLDSCSSPTCTVTYYDDGRTKLFTDNGSSWFFVYDADGRLISACKATSCSGSIDRVDYLYDGSGRRTQIKESDWNGSTTVVTTTDLRYEGATVVQELVGGSVTRTYATDDTGRILEVCDPDCATGVVYIVAWNGHGDATALWKKNTDGSLSLANSYTYSTWGQPTTTVAGGFTDLKFRYLYVGAFDVQWDSSFGLNLAYMHARHYSPALGRFIQPDPSGGESNSYAYADNNPVTRSDPDGACAFLCVIAIAFVVSAIISAASYIATQNAAHQPVREDELVVAFFTGGFTGAGCVATRSIAWCGRIAGTAAVLQYHLSHGPKYPEGYLLNFWLGRVLGRYFHAPYVPKPPPYTAGLSWWILYGYPGMSRVANAFQQLMVSTGVNWGHVALWDYWWR